MHARVQEASEDIYSMGNVNCQTMKDLLGRGRSLKNKSMVSRDLPQWTDSSFHSLLESVVDEVVFKNILAITAVLRDHHQRVVLTALSAKL